MKFFLQTWPQLKAKIPPSTIRKTCFLIVTFASFVTFLNHKRYYPFSDYYMFSYLRKNLNNYALVLKDNDNKYVFLKNRDVSPLTRMHIHQMIGAGLRANLGFGWLEVYANKFKGKSQYQSIAVCEAIFDEKTATNRVSEVIYEKPIH